MYRKAGSGSISVTAAQAILGIYLEYSDEYAVELGQLLELIEEAYGPDGHHSGNHVIRSIRMLRRVGFTQSMLTAAVHELRASNAFSPRRVHKVPNPHAHEVVPSNWRYPLGWKPLSVQEKADRIARVFYTRMSRPSRHAPTGFLHDDFHDLVALKPSVFAKWMKVRNPYSPEGYARLLVKLADHVASAYRKHHSGHGFHKSLLDMKLNRSKIRIEMLRSTLCAIREIERRSRGPFMVFPGQLGMRWRGSSIERVVWHTENEDFSVGQGWKEFVLPAYVVFFELMADPQRLSNNGVLAMYCGGDVVTDSIHYHRTGTSFGFGAENLHLLPENRTAPNDYYGVTTGLVRKV